MIRPPSSPLCDRCNGGRGKERELPFLKKRRCSWFHRVSLGTVLAGRQVFANNELDKRVGDAFINCVNFYNENALHRHSSLHSHFKANWSISSLLRLFSSQLFSNFWMSFRHFSLWGIQTDPFTDSLAHFLSSIFSNLWRSFWNFSPWGIQTDAASWAIFVLNFFSNYWMSFSHFSPWGIQTDLSLSTQFTVCSLYAPNS